eukprot:g18310.t1
MAAVEKLRAEGGEDAIEEATVAMGLSLGEYSALSFAGALSWEAHLCEPRAAESEVEHPGGLMICSDV